MLFGGSPSPRVPRPVPSSSRYPLPRLGSGRGAPRERSGRAGRAGEDSGRAPEGRRAPPAPPPPSPRSGRGRRLARRLAGAPPPSLLACPGAPLLPAAHPSAGCRGPRRPEPGRTAAAGWGRVLASPCGLSLAPRAGAQGGCPGSEPPAQQVGTGQSWWGWVRVGGRGAGGRACAWKVPAGWRCQRRRGSCPREARERQTVAEQGPLFS